MGIIGISANLLRAEKRTLYQNMALYYAEENIVKLIEKNGHTPLILPLLQDYEKNAVNFINIIDGLILSGGTDISCSLYNEELKNEKWKGDLERDLFEIKLLEEAKKQNKPVLGICRGFQLINVAYGGSLFQDIQTMRSNSYEHRNQEKYEKNSHAAIVLKDTWLFNLLKTEKIIINSVHHQGIKKLGKKLEVLALSNDNLIESIKAIDADFVLGIQWHPEWMDDKDISKKVFYAFLDKIN
ncbi:MAG: gamma-glutamyl-gamma-aminobutyrate hydrolase family protein [Candidatus Sericytochromatia bacterium]